MGAAPIGMPGWPLLAFSTASTARKRMVSMAFFSSSGFRVSMCSLGNGRRCVTRLGQKGCFAGGERGGAQHRGVRIEHHLHGYRLDERPHASLGEEGGAEPAVLQLGQDLRRDAA